VLGVGSRVMVMARGNGSGGVRLMDAAGQNAIATVADGVEVEILAWHPRRGGETRYRVVQTTGGVEGWIGAASLKPRPAPPTPIRVAQVPPTRLATPAARTKLATKLATKPATKLVTKPVEAPRVRRPPVAAKARKAKR
jgi:hypothetical protein